jgi:hypothetical protein
VPGTATAKACTRISTLNSAAPITGVYRIDPTSFFNVRGNISYAPQPWLMLGANFVFQEGKNNAADINFNQHNYVCHGNCHDHAG